MVSSYQLDHEIECGFVLTISMIILLWLHLRGNFRDLSQDFTVTSVVPRMTGLNAEVWLRMYLKKEEKCVVILVDEFL
jgi:hypothetical protein